MQILKFKKSLSIVAVSVIILSYIISSGVLLFNPKTARAATTFTVTKVADTNDGTCDADCSLREAITAANSNAGADIIEFNITPADGTAYTITPLSELPTITEQLKIDGTAQSGSSCSARTLKVEIDGTNETYGLQTTANNFELYGVAINRVAGQHGVRVLNASNPTISCNNFGTDVTGTTAGIGNAQDGVALENVTGGTVGSTTLADRNIMAGNGQAGVELVDGTNGVNVIGNYIGTDFAGTTAIGNAYGVAVWGANGNIIGGTAVGDRNIISGNTGEGVEIDADNVPNPSVGNTIEGNYIGTRPDGVTALANTTHGIALLAGSGTTTVGGATASSRNIISGNGQNGVYIDSSDSNTIEGNYVGTDVNGTADVGNGANGVALFNTSSSNIIGGTTTGQRNIISGNTSKGVDIENTGSNNNTIAGNYVGTNANGDSAIANGGQGVGVAGGSGNLVGGTASGSRNIISGNTSYGVALADDSTVQGNYIGLNAAGDTVIANGLSSANIGIIGGSNNTIGGNSAAARNVIAGPAIAAIQIIGGSAFGGGPSTGNKIQGNYIGTDANGVTHSGFGSTKNAIIMVFDAQNNIVGGAGAGEGNLIMGNSSGVGISNFAGFEALNNSIMGNSIYNNTGGSAPSNLGIDLLGSTVNGTVFTDAGVTANDAGDTDVLSNHLMNFPVISSITSTNGQATITYDLDINDAEAGATGYRVEFFANDSADPTGYGQGQTYLGYDTVAGDVSGKQVTITLPAGVDGSKYITATTTMIDNSTDGFGHSSEFSADVQATLVPVVPTPSPTSASGLASTGSSTKWILPVALLLIALGSFALFVVYKIRQQQNL